MFDVGSSGHAHMLCQVFTFSLVCLSFSFCFRLVGFTSDGDVVFYYSTAEITIPSRKSALIVVEFGLLALQTTSADY